MMSTSAQLQTLITPNATEIQLPAGTHKIDKTIKVYSGNQIRGHPDGCTLIQATPESTIFEAAERHAHVHDLGFFDLALEGTRFPVLLEDGTEAPAPGGFRYHSMDRRVGAGIHIPGTQIEDLVFDNVSTAYLGACGILVGQSGKITIKRVLFNQCQALNNYGPDWTFDRGIDSHPYGGLLQAGFKDVSIYTADCEDVSVIDCHFRSEFPTVPGAEIGAHADTRQFHLGNDSGFAIVGNGHEGFCRNLLIDRSSSHGHKRHGFILAYGSLVPVNLICRHSSATNNGWVGFYLNAEPIEDFEAQGQKLGIQVTFEDCVADHNAAGGSSSGPQDGEPDVGFAQGSQNLGGGICYSGVFEARVSRCKTRHNGYEANDVTAAMRGDGIKYRSIHTVISECESWGNAAKAYREWGGYGWDMSGNELLSNNVTEDPDVPSPQDRGPGEDVAGSPIRSRRPRGGRRSLVIFALIMVVLALIAMVLR